MTERNGGNVAKLALVRILPEGFSKHVFLKDTYFALHSTDMGEEDRGGLPNLNPKSRSGFFNLPTYPDTSG